MEYSNVIIFVLVLILILFVFVIMINFIMPFKFKSDFDDISSSYHTLVQLEGGISSSVRAQLEKELEDIGMSDITIRCKSIDEVRYGERFELYVSATVNLRSANKYLVFENKKETLEFRRISFSKKLVN
jgi:inhibitor of KinA sporulation pathway (predicted exonuclease)